MDLGEVFFGDGFGVLERAQEGECLVSALGCFLNHALLGGVDHGGLLCLSDVRVVPEMLIGRSVCRPKAYPVIVAFFTRRVNSGLHLSAFRYGGLGALVRGDEVKRRQLGANWGKIGAFVRCGVMRRRHRQRLLFVFCL